MRAALLRMLTDAGERGLMRDVLTAIRAFAARRHIPDDGLLEIGLGVLVALVAVPVHLVARDHPAALLVDLALCLTAPFAAWRPPLGRLAFGATLITCLVVNPHDPTVGAFATAIPVLGAGLRGQRRMRAVWAAILLVWVAVFSLASGERGGDLLGNAALFGALFAGMWLIGDAFAAGRSALQEATRRVLIEQRAAIARDLHDVIAHDLSNLSLWAQASLLAGNGSRPELEFIAQTSSQCIDEMRRLLQVLRSDTFDQGATAGTWRVEDATSSLAALADRLRADGFSVAVDVGAQDAPMTAMAQRSFGAILTEVGNNIVKHGDCSRPVTIIGEGLDASLEVAIANYAKHRRGGSKHQPLGLVGMRERAYAAGGQLDASLRGEKWSVRLVMPLRVEQRLLLADDGGR